MLFNALMNVINQTESRIRSASIRRAVLTLMPVTPGATGPLESYLSGGFGLVVVIVGGQIDVFVDAVQQPQEELQGVVLRVATKLRSVLGHYGLQREREREVHAIKRETLSVNAAFVV